ncbi:MAG: AMP-binding protein [Gammaproteobacteria bacterium]|nr:AMP-binding protein [Gammaproteobacteria bacterium]MCD8543030.1 AMP-binding protein [Gammaproteobacteria bacterium]
MNFSIHRLISLVSDQYPDNIAVQNGAQIITYKELDERSNSFAAYLISLGVRPGCFIPIIARKSVSVFIVLLGILKTGAAYVPISTDFSIETIHKILSQIEAKIICIDDDILTMYDKNEVIRHIPLSFVFSQENNLQAKFDCLEGAGNEYAYMVFTSGSTGDPKGVLVTHNNLIATYRSWEVVYQLSPDDKHLQMANISFDVFAGDWIRAFCSGATLVLCDKSVLLSAEKLYYLIDSVKITVAEFVPAILRILIKYCERKTKRLSSFRLLLCGSDVWTMSEYRKVKLLCEPQARVVSSYGLTEATIDSTYFEEKNGSLLKNEDLVPLGVPFPHVSTYIVNEEFEAKDSGELLIGGQGVAHGYFNNNALEQGRFITGSDHKQKLFRTGDCVKKLSDGNIYFYGRNIHCINVRGVRIDLNAVESTLKGHPDIEQALLLTKNTNDESKSELDLYIVPNNDSLTYNSVKEYIIKKINNFPFPKSIFIVEQLFLTFNNKINRKYIPTEIKKVLTEHSP